MARYIRIGNILIIEGYSDAELLLLTRIESEYQRLDEHQQRLRDFRNMNSPKQIPPPNPKPPEEEKPGNPDNPDNDEQNTTGPGDH